MSLDATRWTKLWRSLGAAGDPQPWFTRLAAAYAEPQRHYHTAQHIAECLDLLDQTRHLAPEPAAIEIALWFHDAVYDPRAADNEERSAALAIACLKETGAEGALTENVSRWVMATKDHVAGQDPNAGLLVDVDLSILGQPEARFSQYEAQIREEYSWVPRLLFGPKRAAILSRFLERDHIFVTDWFRQRFESQARRNLEGSIRQWKRWFA